MHSRANHGYGAPAFNGNNLEQIQAIMEAAQACETQGQPAWGPAADNAPSPFPGLRAARPFA